MSIKAQTCADGPPQQESTAKQESSSPTASLESIMLTSVVGAMEDQDVATVDISNVFVQMDLPTEGPEEKQPMMKVRGKLALLRVQTNPQLCQKCIAMEKGLQ